MVGLGSLGYGLTLVVDNGDHPIEAPTSPAGSQAVSAHGAGTFTGALPQEITSPNEALCAGCDVVLITVCSLRRDHVGAYGEIDGLTPALDTLMAGASRFDRAYSASNFTLASLTAIFTGRFGSTTGVLGWDQGLQLNVPVMAEIFGIYGYHTGGFTIDAPSGFRPDYGLDRGFQHLQIITPPRDTPDGRRSGGDPGPGGASARPVAAWLDQQPKDRPVFVEHHNRSAHFPFVIGPDGSDLVGSDPAPDPTNITQLLWDAGQDQQNTGPMPGTAGGTAQQGVVPLKGPDPLQAAIQAGGAAAERMWKQRYAESVRRMDLDIQVIAEALARRGRLDRTVLVLVADHGESLNDHGELLHGDAYWDGVVRVPLLIKIPGVQGRTLSGLVSHVDLLPTLLELVGAMPPAGLDGVSLLPMLTGQAEVAREATFVEGGVTWLRGEVLRGAVVAPPWMLMRQDAGCGPGSPPGAERPSTCLFNLDDDPGQLQNRARSDAAVASTMLERWAVYQRDRASAARALELSPAYVEELRRTGYDFRKP